MTAAAIRRRIKRHEDVRDEHLAEDRPKSAEMEGRVISALYVKLEEALGGSPKDE